MWSGDSTGRLKPGQVYQDISYLTASPNPATSFQALSGKIDGAQDHRQNYAGGILLPGFRSSVYIIYRFMIVLFLLAS